jgi:hypothetical protein
MFSVALQCGDSICPSVSGPNGVNFSYPNFVAGWITCVKLFVREQYKHTRLLGRWNGHINVRLLYRVSIREVWTRPDLRHNYPPECPAQVEFCARRNWVCIRSAIQRRPVDIQTTSTLEPYGPQHDRVAACVIAQQYSSATIMTLRFRSLKGKFGVLLKTLFFFNFYFLKIWQVLNCVNWKCV